jgi:hypothetical protein
MEDGMISQANKKKYYEAMLTKIKTALSLPFDSKLGTKWRCGSMEIF